MTTEPAPPATCPDDAMTRLRERTIAYATWERAHEALSAFCQGRHHLHVPPQPEDDDLVISEMLRRGQQAEQERDALIGYVRAIDERAELVDDDCACVICQAYRALPETVRARLEATDGQ